MTRPETCGEAGSAISLWVNVIDCDWGGIVSSFHSGRSGAIIYCKSGDIWYDTLILPIEKCNKSSSWWMVRSCWPVNIRCNFLKKVWRTSTLFYLQKAELRERLINIRTSNHFNADWQSSLSLSFEEYFIIIVFSQVWSHCTQWIFRGFSPWANQMVPPCIELHCTQQWWRNQGIYHWSRSGEWHRKDSIVIFRWRR